MWTKVHKRTVTRRKTERFLLLTDLLMLVVELPADSRLGKNSSHVLSHMWTKVHAILGHCGRPSVIPKLFALCLVATVFAVLLAIRLHPHISSHLWTIVHKMLGHCTRPFVVFYAVSRFAA